jgi:hypothetical protein
VDRSTHRRMLAFLLLVTLLLATPLAAQRHVRHTDDDGREQFSIIGTIFAYGFILQIAAVVHWTRKRPDTFWLWIIIIGGAIGAIAYFLVEGAPDFRRLRSSLKGPARRRRIAVLRAIVIDNPAAGNYEELGELLLEEKKYAEARKAFDAALASRTDSVHPFYFRGVAAFELRDYAAAIADLRHVVGIDPKHDYSRAQSLLARACAAAGRTAEAEAAFERLIQTSTSAESLCAAAEFFIAQGRTQQARELVEAILARRVTMPSYQKRRDRLWLRKAKQLSRRLRKVTPSPVTATA